MKNFLIAAFLALAISMTVHAPPVQAGNLCSCAGSCTGCGGGYLDCVLKCTKKAAAADTTLNGLALPGPGTIPSADTGTAGAAARITGGVNPMAINGADLAYMHALNRGFNISMLNPADYGYGNMQEMRGGLGAKANVIRARQSLIASYIRDPFGFAPNFAKFAEFGFPDARAYMDFLAGLDALISTGTAMNATTGTVPGMTPSAQGGKGYWPLPYCLFHPRACKDYNKTNLD